MSSNILKKSAINFHFTRVCNYECKFCFHTKKTSYMLPLENQKLLIKILKEEGAEKINFAGGEPFLYPETLGQLVKYSKEIGFNSTSIISNGSKIKRDFFEKYSKWLDILGISCDSINPIINFEHGRKVCGSVKSRDETKKIREISEFCNRYEVFFKINTVVTKKNKDENLSHFINELNPMRWKIFQVLDIDGENYDTNSGENFIKDLLIKQEEFENYIKINKEGLYNKESMVIEDNEKMRASYILIDEYGRFLNTSFGMKIPTKSILDVGVESALEELLQSNGIGFDKKIEDRLRRNENKLNI